MSPGEDIPHLLRAVRDALSQHASPSDHPEDISPRSWEGWLMVCLLRQRARQRQLVARVEQCLQQDPTSVQGDLPGTPPWSYSFDDEWCAFKRPGETVNVRFHADHGRVGIDPLTFSHRVLTLTAPELPEARLAALLSGRSLICAALEALAARGLLERPPGTSLLLLGAELEALVEPALALEDQESAWRQGLACLGDFEAPEFAADGEGQVRREGARQLRRTWLLSVVSHPPTSKDALHALESLLTRDERVRVCERILGDTSVPVSEAMASAVQHLDAMPGAAGHEAVLGLLVRMSPTEDFPYSLQLAARYLLRRGIERERTLAAMLASARAPRVQRFRGNPFADEFAFLALEFAPERARELTRLALRSPSSSCRLRMTAVLRLLSRPWCQHELLLAHQERGGQKDLRRVVVALDSGHIAWTQQEMSHEGSLQYLMDQLRPWVERIRTQLPEDAFFDQAGPLKPLNP